MLDTLVRLPKRLEGLIEALLYYSRVGRSELQLQKTNINALVHEICDTLQVFLAEKNAEVLLPEPLPEVVCDRARINEVFMNLITNGVKYNDKKNITIEIGCETTAGGFVFYVKDNGIGIKPEHHERIFRMFKRLHHRDAFGGGTGAGLAFVKRIIETHKGRIWVESTPEQGSTFYFTLPEGA